MNEIKNVLICGIGAIGSIYANKIQKYNPESLKVLVDEQRLEQYQKEPIIFNGEELIFDYVLPEVKDYKADLIIIATKYDGLNDAIRNIKNFIKEDTIIISLLNGVTSESLIAREYGWDKLLYAYFIGSSAVRTGRNIITKEKNTVVFGSDEPNDSKVERVKKFFDKIGVSYKNPDNIKRALWLKFIINVCSNQISAILRLTFGEMQRNSHCIDFMKKVAEEVRQIAIAEGIQDTDTIVDEAINQIMKITPEGKTSMLQDVESGRKTEVDMFAGTVIELGKKHNIATPYNIVIKKLIEITEENQSYIVDKTTLYL